MRRRARCSTGFVATGRWIANGTGSTAPRMFGDRRTVHGIRNFTATRHEPGGTVAQGLLREPAGDRAPGRRAGVRVREDDRALPAPLRRLLPEPTGLPLRRRGGHPECPA